MTYEDEITDVVLARTALEIIRDSGLAPECRHPAEALERVDIADSWVCPLCGTHTTDEVLVRALTADGPRTAWRGRIVL